MILYRIRSKIRYTQYPIFVSPYAFMRMNRVVSELLELEFDDRILVDFPADTNLLYIAKVSGPELEVFQSKAIKVTKRSTASDLTSTHVAYSAFFSQYPGAYIREPEMDTIDMIEGWRLYFHAFRLKEKPFYLQ